MTSIPIEACRTFGNKFKRRYRKNKVLGINFLLHLRNLRQIYDIVRKNYESPSLSISEIIDSKKSAT